jgi:hypothetical protein
LRAKIIKDLKELDSYGYAGHSAIMGKEKNNWQDVEYVLENFGRGTGRARKGYRKFVEEGLKQGKRPDLVGGGLVRSLGGWSGVKAMRKAKQHVMSDERMLGDSDFVEKVLKESEEKMDQRTQYEAQGYDLRKIGERVEETLGVRFREVCGQGKERWKVVARDLYCYWAVREVGYSMTEVGRKLRIRQPTVSISAKRGEQIAKERGYYLAK